MAIALSTIRTRWRAVTGRSSTNDISDADVNTRLNEYMQLRMPFEVDLDSFQADWTQETDAADDGEYTLGQAVVDINEPILCNATELTIYHNKERFFQEYPLYADEDFITPPTLVIGTTSAAKVKNSAFKYKIGDYTYSKASTETTMSGDNVPSNHWGAWLLEIDAAGTITVTAAAANSTGYDSMKAALEALTATGATYAIMGYVLIYTTATFIPGTTLFSAAAVTDYFTDGDPGMRGTPNACCVAGGKMWVRPLPDDIYLLRAVLSVTRLTALSADGDTVHDDVLAQLIVYGSGIEYLSEKGEAERVAELMPIYERYQSHVSMKRLKQDHNRESIRSF
jgi:hypothetical protein